MCQILVHTLSCVIFMWSCVVGFTRPTLRTENSTSGHLAAPLFFPWPAVTAPQTGWLRAGELFLSQFWKFEIKVSMVYAPSESSRLKSFFASSSSWRLRAIPGITWLWQHHSYVCLHHHKAFFLLAVCIFHSSYKNMSHFGLKNHAHPAWPHLTTTYICKEHISK